MAGAWKQVIGGCLLAAVMPVLAGAEDISDKVYQSWKADVEVRQMEHAIRRDDWSSVGSKGMQCHNGGDFVSGKGVADGEWISMQLMDGASQVVGYHIWIEPDASLLGKIGMTSVLVFDDGSDKKYTVVNAGEVREFYSRDLGRPGGLPTYKTMDAPKELYPLAKVVSSPREIPEAFTYGALPPRVDMLVEISPLELELYCQKGMKFGSYQNTIRAYAGFGVLEDKDRLALEAHEKSLLQWDIQQLPSAVKMDTELPKSVAGENGEFSGSMELPQTVQGNEGFVAEMERAKSLAETRRKKAMEAMEEANSQNDEKLSAPEKPKNLSEELERAKNAAKERRLKAASAETREDLERGYMYRNARKNNYCWKVLEYTCTRESGDGNRGE